MTAEALMKFMRENGADWVGPREAALFIAEFTNDSLREDDCDEGDLNFAELQRCFLPSESIELRAALSQRECSNKQAYLPI